MQCVCIYYCNYKLKVCTCHNGYVEITLYICVYKALSVQETVLSTECSQTHNMQYYQTIFGLQSLKSKVLWCTFAQTSTHRYTPISHSAHYTAGTTLL